MDDVLVSPGWLAGRLGSVVLLDVRGEVLPQEPRYRAYPERYLEAHLPGAVFVDWRHTFTDRSAEVPVTVASPAEFAEAATALGIGAESVVVAYDEYWNALAGRIVWVLRSYGHLAAHLLDGGLAAWREAGLPLESGQVAPSPATPPHPLPSRLDGLIDLKAVQAALEDGALIVDTRAAAEYHGDETHARRAGHIPGAVNVPYRSLLAADGSFLPVEELRRRLVEAGVPLDEPLIAYCNGGVSSTVVAHAVERACGRRPLIYDGSWNEWGNRSDTPVER